MKTIGSFYSNHTQKAGALGVGGAIRGLTESQVTVVRGIIRRRGGKVRAFRKSDFTYTVRRIA